MKNEPAFPIFSKHGWPTNLNDLLGGTANGMSKRFFAACMAMQGMLASEYLMKAIERIAQQKTIDVGVELIHTAYEFADELIKQEYND